MQRTQTRLRIGFGLVAIVAVLALVAFMTMVSNNGDTNSVSATGSTPTTEPNPGTNGFLSGIYDLEVFPGANAAYHCIIRLDHDTGTNRIKASAQCNTDIAGLGDPSDVLFDVIVPGEGPDGVSGPPPPPPYSNLPTTRGAGEYYPGGHADCPGATTCAVVTICVEDFGSGALGPNLIGKLILDDPNVTPDVITGKAELYAGASIKECDSLDVTGLSVFGAPLDLGFFTPGGSSPTSWRTAAITANAGAVTDFDGDGCSDLDELNDKSRPKTCGDDPYNPADSNVTDHSGAYTILVRVTRADVTGAGSYFNCLADIQQNGDGKSTDADPETAGLVARVFCYTDGSLAVNKLAYPGVTGDGYPGGGPPYGSIPAVDDPETDCTRLFTGTSLDEDNDGTPNDGCASEGFADVDSKQTVLTGYIDNGDNTLKLRGCFEDEDASGDLLNVYTEVTIDRYTGEGTTDIWALQDLSDCTDPHAWGTYEAGPGGEPLTAFDDAGVQIVRQPGGKFRDTDQDGIPNAVELRDDDGGGATSNCGSRDPGNPYDWYDVNQDGVIDLLGDILGVIQHYAPGGAPPYDIIFDRPSTMVGSAGSWNRGEPDGVIDLLGDILGVIQQYHPGAC